MTACLPSIWVHRVLTVMLLALHDDKRAQGELALTQDEAALVR